MTLRSSLTIYLLDYHRAVPHEYPMSNKKRLRNFSKPLIYWSWREDSNPRPADYKSDNTQFHYVSSGSRRLNQAFVIY